MQISDEYLDQWRTHGFALVPDVLSPDEIAEAVDNVLCYTPPWEDYAAAPKRYPYLDTKEVFRFEEAPFVGDALNDLATHPDLVSFAERALRTDRVFLTQAIMWPKYATTADFDQPLHIDYHDNTLAVPSSDPTYEQLSMIVYLTDVDTDGAPTEVVSWQDSKGRPIVPYEVSRDEDPELYDHAQRISATAGSALLYTTRTWHRGTGFRRRAGARFTMHLVYRQAGQEWMSWRGWAQYADRPEMQRFLTRAQPKQREVLGFPSVSDAFWTDETITALEERYPGIDTGPYRRARSSPARV